MHQGVSDFFTGCKKERHWLQAVFSEYGGQDAAGSERANDDAGRSINPDRAPQKPQEPRRHALGSSLNC